MAHIYKVQDGFVAGDESIDRLHALPEGVTDPAWSETLYLGFNIPEAAITCEIYFWFHPVLKVASGGVMLWQGHKAISPQAEHLDYRNFMAMPAGDLDDMTFSNGVRVRITEPGREVHVEYKSNEGDVEFDFVSTAIMPAAVRADGLHYAQAVRTRGELRLHDGRHVIDGYFTRDRSWSGPRPEVPLPLPPLTWGAAVFGDDLAIHFVAHDQPEDDHKPPRWGYVFADGEVRAIREMAKNTVRQQDSAAPKGTQIAIVDSAGQRYELDGVSQGCLPVTIWPNMVTYFTQMRYTLDGREGYGDFQDILYPSAFRMI